MNARARTHASRSLNVEDLKCLFLSIVTFQVPYAILPVHAAMAVVIATTANISKSNNNNSNKKQNHQQN